MDEGDVAEVGDGAGGVPTAEGDPDRGRDDAVDAGQTAVADDEAALVRRPGERHDVEVADRVGRPHDEARVGPHRPAHGGRDEQRRDRPGRRGIALEGSVDEGAEPGVRRAPLLQPGGVAGARGGLVEAGHGVDDPGDAAGVGGDPARRAHRDHVDRGVADQSGDGPREGRVPDDDDPLDPVAQRGREQQAVGPDRVRPDPGARRRLGEQRPPAGLGEQAGGGSGVVPGHDDGARSAGQHLAGRLRDHRDGGGYRGRGGGRRALPPGADALGEQRVVELEVELGRAGARAGRGDGGIEHVTGARRVEVVARGEGREEVGLERGLVGPGAAQPGGPVGADDDEAPPGVVRLHHRREEVADGRARGGDDGDGPPRAGRETEREEAGAALVDAHVQPQVARGVGGMRTEGERGRPGSGGEHDVAHPAEPELLEQGERELRRGGRRRGGSHRGLSRSRGRRASG